MRRRIEAAILCASLIAAGCAAMEGKALPVAEQGELTIVSDAIAIVSPEGDWHGTLELPQGAKLRIDIHVDRTPLDVLSGTISSPDQGANGLAMDSLSFADGVFTFTMKTQTWTGRWDADQKAWAGVYALPGAAVPMVFRPGPLPALAPNPVIAGLDGRWEGKVMDMLPLVLRVATDANGTVALMDSPLQNVANLAVPIFTREGDTVSFEMPALAARFTGKLSAEGDRITGAFTQGQESDLVLKFISKDITPAVAKQRLQTPSKPYPYSEIETGYDNPQNPGVHIPCTLTLPPGPGRHPAALLLSGSGAQDRDETMLGHKPFLVLADHLTRKGIAVLRCDDRDYVQPPASGEASLIPQFVSDAGAAIAMLRARPEIDATRIGVIGHSEGGVTGPRLAAQDPSIAFVVTLAGVGVKGADALVEQRVLLSASTGVPKDRLGQIRQFSRDVFNAVLAASDKTGARAAALAVLKAQSPPTDKPAPTEQSLEAAADLFASDYIRDLLAYDPALYVPKIQAPFLAINGSKDLQVEAKQNLGGFKKLLAANKDATFVELPGLNHFFQTVRTGAVSEYGDTDETFAPAALNLVSDWIVKRMLP